MTWPTTDAFKAALRKSHTPTMKVEILEGGVVVASTDVLSLTQEITVLSGSVSDDRKALVGRRHASWELIDRTGGMLPITTDDVLYPLRDRDVRLWRGIGTELVPLATVQLAVMKITEQAAGLTYSMSGSDRSTVLAGSDWRSEFVVTAGQTPRAATLSILARVDPTRTYVLVDSPTSKTMDEMVFLPGEDPDPWTAIQKIWEAAAMEVFFDQMGQIKAQPIPNPATAPVAWQFLDDSASIRVAPMGIEVNRDSLRNGVIVRGSAGWLLYGVTGEAWDTDTTSSTYYDPANPTASAVGPHPEYIDDSLVGSEAEATAVAVAKLPDLLGIEETVEFSSIPNPALEAGDVVEIQTDVIGNVSRFILDQVSTPLTFDGTQTANTRRRTR